MLKRDEIPFASRIIPIVFSQQLILPYMEETEVLGKNFRLILWVTDNFLTCCVLDSNPSSDEKQGSVNGNALGHSIIRAVHGGETDKKQTVCSTLDHSAVEQPLCSVL